MGVAVEVAGVSSDVVVVIGEVARTEVARTGVAADVADVVVVGCEVARSGTAGVAVGDSLLDFCFRLGLGYFEPDAE